MRAPLYLYIPLYCLLSVFMCSAQAQTFPCDGRLIISLHQNSPPNYMHRIGNVNNNQLLDFEDLTTYPSIYFNAIGYNRLDNYIYACQRESNNIIRLNQDGNSDVVGEIPVPNLSNPGAGDCTPEGLYACWENNINKLLFFKVVNEFELVEELGLYWGPMSGNSGVFSVRIDDIVFDPFEPGVAYAFQRNYPSSGSGPVGTQGSLLRINVDLGAPQAGQVSVIGSIPANIIRHIGALFFDSQGKLYGYGSLQGLPNLNQTRLVSIDKDTGDAELLGIGPGAEGNDGCSCPYGIVFEKTVSQDSLYCNTETVTFDISIQSRHVEGISGAILRDTLPEGLIISDINTDMDGIITTGTGVGSRILELTDVSLSTGETYYLEITAELQQINVGNYQNQAFLSNLPSELGGIKLSDNTNTQEVFNDPTPFEVLPQATAQLDFSAFPASNCEDPNDGGIQLFSPFFETGNDYLFELNNENGESFSLSATSTADGQIILDELPPGNYVISTISPASTACHLRPDLSFELPAPNHLLDLSAGNAGPVCSGNEAALFGSSNVGGTYTWTGPLGFTSNLQNPSIPSVTEAQAGEYMLHMSFGACDIEATTVLDVKPGINLDVIDTVTVCSGAPIEIQPNGNLQEATISWTSPSNDILISSVFKKTQPAATADEGLYKVEASNDWCNDSTTFWLDVVSPPSILLDSFLAIDYCESQTLRPIVQDSTGGLNFQWAPEGGLSCTDCLHPAILDTPQPSYTLTVTNEATCKDSARIVLNTDINTNIYIPDAFSPNNDGANDTFTLYPNCAVKQILKFYIFDRWGNQVFTAENYDPKVNQAAWDGTAKGERLSTSLFTWMVEMEFVNGTTEVLSGDVQLIR